MLPLFRISKNLDYTSGTKSDSNDRTQEACQPTANLKLICTSKLESEEATNLEGSAEQFKHLDKLEV
ncbi:hypothetical protein P3S67_012131 [Capsicum chacoense]